MRVGVPLASAPATLYSPLGIDGQPIFSSYMQLRAILKQRFGSLHADCFARPDQDPRDETIRWYADCPGEARSWTQLSPADQAGLALTLEMLRADFDACSQALRSESGDGSVRKLALLLAQAPIIPGPEHLHLVGNQPVLSFWGFEREKGQGINALGLRPPAVLATVSPTVVAAPVLSRPSRWRWWWLILPFLLFLLLFCFWLFVGRHWAWMNLPFGTGPNHDQVQSVPTPTLPQDVGTPPVLPPVSGQASPGGLSGGAGSGAAGVPSLPDAVPSMAKGEAPVTDIPSPVKPASPVGTVGEVGPPPMPPLPPAATEGGPVRPIEPITIPPGALQRGDLGFLEGEWQSRKGIIDQHTGEPLRQTYRFDKSGRGEVIVRRADGVECRGAVAGGVIDGKLSVKEQGALVCPDGRSYQPAETRCERIASGVTVCRGQNSDGSGYRVDLDRAK